MKKRLGTPPRTNADPFFGNLVTPQDGCQENNEEEESRHYDTELMQTESYETPQRKNG